MTADKLKTDTLQN